MCGCICDVQLDSVNKPGILLEVVQILSDLDLIITKAYISSDGGFFMDGIFFLIIFIFYNFSNLYFLIVTIFATGFYVHLRNILLYVTFSICFGPVFHVTDQLGNKITDSKTIDYIEKVSPCCLFSVLCFSALYQKRPILVAQFHEVPQLNCVAKISFQHI